MQSVRSGEYRGQASRGRASPSAPKDTEKKSVREHSEVRSIVSATFPPKRMSKTSNKSGLRESKKMECFSAKFLFSSNRKVPSSAMIQPSSNIFSFFVAFFFLATLTARTVSVIESFFGFPRFLLGHESIFFFFFFRKINYFFFFWTRILDI